MISQEYIDRGAGWWRPVAPDVIPLDLTEIFQKSELERKIAELESLLARAREYDKRMGQPDCPEEDKKAALRLLAEHFGLKINFPGEEDAEAATSTNDDKLSLNEWTA